jgi:hypothetical protein
MLQRTKEKSKRKKDKEKLKELGVILGVGVEALLKLAREAELMEDQLPSGGLGLNDDAMHVMTGLGIGLSTLEPGKGIEHEPGGPGDHFPPTFSAPCDTTQAGDKPEPKSAGLRLSLGFSPGVPASPSSYAQLRERTRAMRRLAARMKIKRRDISMRSLLEAGNMAELSMEEEECGEHSRSMHVRRAGRGSPLTKEITFAEEDNNEDGENELGVGMHGGD